jgi:hypothetical protein
MSSTLASGSGTPEIQALQWLNSPGLSLASLRGRVVAIHAFQMLCPGCVAHGLPQAKKIKETFSESLVMLIGLHSVFEHHEAMQPVSLQAFVREYRLDFPIAIDQPNPDGPIPLTMTAYELEGTPTLVLLDKQGRMRLRHLGQIDDLRLGAILGQLIAEPSETDGN